MTGVRGAGQRRHPRALVLTGAVAAVALLAGLSACTGGGGAAAPTSTATPSASSTAPGSAPTTADTAPTRSSTQTPTTAQEVGATTLPAVAAGSPAPFGDGLVAVVKAVDDVQVSAGAPGEVAGPAVAVTVVLENGSEAAVDLSGVSVTAASSSGAPLEQTTASPSSVPRGVLSTGDEVTGTWVFSVPGGERTGAVLTIESTSASAAVQVTL